MLFPGANKFTNRIINLNLGLSSAQNFATQISELKRVINDFKSNEKLIKPMSVLDLDSRQFIINNAMDSIISYLRISNTINQKYKISHYQKLISLNLHMLKLTIEESNLIKLIHSSIREIERKNYIEIRNSKLDIHIKMILKNLEKIELILDDFLMKKGIWSKIKNYIFNDTFGSLYQFKIELMERFNCEEIKITTDEKNKIILDCLLIKANENKSNENSKPNSKNRSKPNSRESSLTNVLEEIVLNPNNLNLKPPKLDKEKSVMIICGPNAAPYEVFAYSDKWIEFYLDYGVSVFLWNYRGFGESKGNINFDNMRKDAECVADFLKKYYKFNKIGVHGISIGGVPACHLAGKNLVNLCFADRCFSSINKVVTSFRNFGVVLEVLYSLFFFKSSQNVESFLNSSAYKILSCDPNDIIINDFSSLKSGISQKLIDDFKLKNLFNNSGSKSNKLLEIIFDKELDELYFSINYIMERIKFYNLDRKVKINYETPKIEINSITTYDKLNEDYANLQSKELDVVLNTEDDVRYKDESKVLYSLKNTLEKFDSAGDSLLSITQIKSLKLKNEFINNFFSNLLIYGSYKIGNVIASEKLIIYRAVSKKFSLLNQKITKIINNPQKYTITDKITTISLKKFLKSLIKIENIFNKIIFKNKSPQNSSSSIIRSLNNLNELNETSEDNKIEITNNTEQISMRSLNSVDQSEMSMTTELNTSNIESYRSAQLSDLIKNLNIGNLIILKCGHNGIYSQAEIELLSLYLLNSKFIN